MNLTQVKTKWLVIVFIVFFILFSLINLPGSLLISGLNNNGVKVREINGTIWNAKLGDISMAGRYWDTGGIQLNKLPLLIGKTGAKFNFSGRDNSLNGKINDINDDVVIFDDLSGFFKTSVMLNNVSYPANISLSSDGVEFLANGQCNSGSININTDIINSLLSNMDLTFPALTGMGNCQQGKTEFFLQTTQNDIVIEYSGELIRTLLTGYLDIKLTPAIEQNRIITGELTVRGFRKEQDKWRLPMELKVQ